MNPKPLVTIGIPVYNASRFILSTLESVSNQTYKNTEVIIIDDGSTDDSAEIINSWLQNKCGQYQFIRNAKNLGLTKTCNLLLRQSHGKYFQKIDADDILTPNKIEKHVDILENLDEAYGLVYSNVRLIDENGHFLDEEYFNRIGYDNKGNNNSYTDLINLNYLPNPSVLAHVSVLKEVGFYDEELLFEDWDMWLRIGKKFKFYYDEDFTACYRIHANSMMMDPAKTIQRNSSVLRMFKKNFKFEDKYFERVLNKIRQLTIYSYVIGDPTAIDKMRWYLKKKFDLKIIVYYLMAGCGIRHMKQILKEQFLFLKTI